MKRRLLSNLLILGLSSLTLLGTGFSIFYFTSTTATDSYSLEVNLARTEVHSLSVRESSDSVLHIDSTVSSQVSRYNSPIYWMNRNTDSEYEYSEGFSLNLYTEDTVSYNFTFTISLDLTIPSELANYITWDNNVNDGWTITGSDTTYSISSNLSNISITPLAFVGFGSMATIPPLVAQAPSDTTTIAFSAASLKDCNAVLPPIWQQTAISSVGIEPSITKMYLPACFSIAS